MVFPMQYFHMYRYILWLTLLGTHDIVSSAFGGEPCGETRGLSEKGIPVEFRNCPAAVNRNERSDTSTGLNLGCSHASRAGLGSWSQ